MRFCDLGRQLQARNISRVNLQKYYKYINVSEVLGSCNCTNSSFIEAKRNAAKIIFLGIVKYVLQLQGILKRLHIVNIFCVSSADAE